MKSIDTNLVLGILLLISCSECFKCSLLKLNVEQCDVMRIFCSPKGDDSLQPKPVSLNSHIKTSLMRPLVTTAIVGLNLLAAKPSHARKGAFEMDAEIYLRNLLGLRPSSQAVFKSLGSFGSPRTLDKAFASSVIDIVYGEVSKLAKVSVDTLQQAVEEKIPYYTKYFLTFAPITKQDITDQYYFDMILYLIYLESAVYLKTSEARVALREKVGSAMLDWLLASSFLSPMPPSKASSFNLSIAIKQLLNTYKEKGLIGDFLFDDEDLADEDSVTQSLSNKMSVNFQITLVRPATILGFLQQAQANTLYHPELTATVVQALARRAGFDLKYDDYLMDNYYREDNFDVQAQDILLECILSSPK